MLTLVACSLASLRLRHERCSATAKADGHRYRPTLAIARYVQGSSEPKLAAQLPVRGACRPPRSRGPIRAAKRWDGVGIDGRPEPGSSTHDRVSGVSPNHFPFIAHRSIPRPQQRRSSACFEAPHPCRRQYGFAETIGQAGRVSGRGGVRRESRSAVRPAS
jgi:hypothetical protein